MSVPVTVGLIPSQSHAPLDVITSIPAANYFTDADATATKTYSATGLPTGLSINSSTGAITGTPSAGGTYSVVLTCTPSSGTPASISFSWVVASAPTAAQTYYVDGTTGNDSWTGLSATFTSGSTGPWKTITRANTVDDHASGHVDIMVAPGTYRNQPWTPANGGADNTHRIRLRVTSTGVVEMLGPSSGAIDHAIVITVPYISVIRDAADRYFRIDGEAVFGTSGGQVAKGQDPDPFAHIRKGFRVNAVGAVLDFDVRRTSSWGGGDIETNCDLCEISVNTDQHGTPYYPDGNDHGDSIPVWGDIPVGS